MILTPRLHLKESERKFCEHEDFNFSFRLRLVSHLESRQSTEANDSQNRNRCQRHGKSKSSFFACEKFERWKADRDYCEEERPNQENFVKAIKVVERRDSRNYWSQSARR